MVLVVPVGIQCICMVVTSSIRVKNDAMITIITVLI